MTPLILKIDVDDRGTPKVENLSNAFDRLDQKTKGSGAGVDAFGKTLTRMHGIIGGVTGAIFSLKGAFATLGIGYLVKGVFQIGTRFEQLQIALDTITKGKGVETFRALNEWALRMPINTEKAIQAYTQMRAMGLEPTIKQMTTLVDATSALGGAPETMMSIAEALGKIQAKGELSARELLQLTSAGVPALEILRKELNDQTISWDNISKSAYSADQLIQALYRGMEERYGGLSERIQKSMSGIIETLTSEWKEFWRSVFMDAGVLSELEGVGNRIVAMITSLRESGKLKEWADVIGGKLMGALKLVEKSVSAIVDHWDAWKRAFGFLLIAVEAFIALKVGIAISEIGYSAVETVKHIGDLKKAFTVFNTTVSEKTVGTQGGLIALVLFGGWEIGTWLNKFKWVQASANTVILAIFQAFTFLKGGILAIWENIKWGFENLIDFVKGELNDIITLANKLPMVNLPLFEMEVGPMESLTERLARTGTQMKEDWKKNYEDFQGAIAYIYSEYEKPGKGIGKYIPAELPKTSKVVPGPVKQLPEIPLAKGYIEFIDAMEGEVTERIEELDYKLRAEFEDTWEVMGKGMEDQFVDSFARMLTGGVHDFKDFAKQILNIFAGTMAQMFSERFFRPIAGALVDSMVSPLKGMMGGIMGKAGGAGGTLAGLGTAGGLFSVGTLGLLGTNIVKAVIGERKPARQDVVLEWEIDEGKVRQVTDYWAGGIAKSDALVSSLNDTMSELSNMFYNMSGFMETSVEKFTVSVASFGQGMDALMQGTDSAFLQMVGKYRETLVKMFGEAYSEIEREYVSGLMKGTMGWKTTIESTEWLQQQIDILYAKFTQFGDDFSKIIGDAFSAALGTGGFAQFKAGLSSGIYELFRQQLIEKFLGEFATQAMRSIWGLYGVGGFESLVSGVIVGTAGPQDVAAAVGGMADAIDALQPAFDAFNAALQAIDQSLGRNTEATVSNTSAVTKQQQIEDFLADLSVGALAPAQSLEAMQSRFQDLMAGGDINKLLGFVSGTLLPFYAAYGGDYQQAYGGVVSDLRGLSASYGVGMSPEAVGQAVASAIAPVIGAQPIRVILEVDGTAIATVLVDQLQTNPALVQSVQEAVR